MIASISKDIFKRNYKSSSIIFKNFFLNIEYKNACTDGVHDSTLVVRNACMPLTCICLARVRKDRTRYILNLKAEKFEGDFCFVMLCLIRSRRQLNIRFSSFV